MMSSHQIPLPEQARADDPKSDGQRDDHTMQIAADLGYRRLAIVNVVFFGLPGSGDRQWTLVDAGIFGTKALIQSAAAERFGARARPAAIILTHGHFDHVGTLEELAAEWDCPIFAHVLEHPYLNGSESYPPPDPSVGGGLMALSSSLFPRGPIDVSRWLRALPADGSIPHMVDWRWLATPGHSPGHVSLWRANDRALVVGDAFVTTRQESVYAALTQAPEMHGPPMYYTPDWDSARNSVRQLAALEPELVVTGHGRAMRGPDMRGALHTLAEDFDRIAIPERGQYVPKSRAHAVDQ